jgi:hypothetical protein
MFGVFVLPQISINQKCYHSTELKLIFKTLSTLNKFKSMGNSWDSLEGQLKLNRQQMKGASPSKKKLLQEQNERLKARIKLLKKNSK